MNWFGRLYTHTHTPHTTHKTIFTIISQFAIFLVSCFLSDEFLLRYSTCFERIDGEMKSLWSALLHYLFLYRMSVSSFNSYAARILLIHLIFPMELHCFVAQQNSIKKKQYRSFTLFIYVSFLFCFHALSLSSRNHFFFFRFFFFFILFIFGWYAFSLSHYIIMFLFLFSFFFIIYNKQWKLNILYWIRKWEKKKIKWQNMMCMSLFHHHRINDG